MTKKRILIVDDEASFTRLVSLNLSYQYYVRIENDSTKALQAALEVKPDMILLDVMMPDMDGGDLAAQIRATPELKHVPIVFLTAAVAKSEVKGHGGEIGGFPFLSKPASIQEIRDCIEAHISG